MNEALYSAIQQSYISDHLHEDDIAKIASISELITMSENQDIVREDDTAKDIYILLEGKVRVTTSTGDPIARLSPGAILGEIALFETEKRSATVVSDGDSTLVKISADRFNHLMDENPQIGVTVLRNIGKTLCQRLRSSNVQLEAVLSVF